MKRALYEFFSRIMLAFGKGPILAQLTGVEKLIPHAVAAVRAADRARAKRHGLAPFLRKYGGATWIDGAKNMLRFAVPTASEAQLDAAIALARVITLRD